MDDAEVKSVAGLRPVTLDLPLFRYADSALVGASQHVSGGFVAGRLRATIAATVYTADPRWRLDVRTCRRSAGWSLTQSLQRLTTLRAPGADFGNPVSEAIDLDPQNATQIAIPIDEVPHTFSVWRLPDRWLAIARLDEQDAVVELMGVGRDLPDDPALINVNPTTVSFNTR